MNAEQMMSGIRSDGSEILPTYTDFTIELKKEKGQPTDRVTLRDTGAFQAAITTDITENTVNTTSTDDKTAGLEKKYGKKIFGLSEKFKAEYLRDDLGPAFIRNCRSDLEL